MKKETLGHSSTGAV